MNEMEKASIQRLPKVELHCHLDGSISLDTLRTIANLDRLELPSSNQALLAEIIAPKVCLNLGEYLKCFRLLTRSLATAEALKLATIDLINQAVSDGIAYIEIRFSPEYASQGKLTMAESIEAVLTGIEIGKSYSEIEVGLLLCMMKGHSDIINQEIIDLAYLFRTEGVCGVDLAGKEAEFPITESKILCQYAVQQNIPLTIHAGETGNVTNVMKAIEFGAKRIGHGIALLKEPADRERFKKENVLLELCPTSNIQTRATRSWKQYPFGVFWDEGLKLSLNTDNRTVSNTTICQEISVISQNYPFVDEQVLKKIMLDSLEGSFATSGVKQLVKEKILHWEGSTNSKMKRC